MRGKFPMKMAVSATALAFIAAGCQSTTEPEAPSDLGGTLRIYASEPSSLYAGFSDDNPSIVIIRQLYKGLVEFSQDGKPVNVMAESIESADNKTWTIKLKKDWKFTNGEVVNADSFIDAWNNTAYGPNVNNNAYFMSHIVGFKDMQSTDPDGDGPQTAPEPKAKTLSGLKKLDDFSFTVELDAPFSGFPAVVGYSGFFPAAKACLADVKVCKETPIGNGPYKLDGTWQHNVQVQLTRNDDYVGGPKGKADKLLFKIYDKQETGYADFEAGELDIFEAVPAPKYKDAKAKYTTSLFEQASNTFTYLGFPLYEPKWQDKGLRQALSLAIDRQAIIDAVFNGRFSTAQGVVSPNFEGYRAGACKLCAQDIAKAKDLFAAYGGAAKLGKVTLWANAGAGHDAWLQAVGDQWKKNLGIEYELNVTLQFPEYLATGDAAKFTGPFRLGWGPDYANVETYLGPLYTTGGSSNNSRYSNPAFDSLVTQGNSADTVSEGIKFYQQAEDLVLDDLPVLPMWFGKVTNVYSANVLKYEYNNISGTEYDKIAVKKQ